MSTAFCQKKANRKWTWKSPDGKTRNMIDFVLVNKRWKSSVLMCRAFSNQTLHQITNWHRHRLWGRQWNAYAFIDYHHPFPPIFWLPPQYFLTSPRQTKLVTAGIRIKLETIQEERCGKRFDVHVGRLKEGMIGQQYSALLKKMEGSGSKEHEHSRTNMDWPWKEIKDTYTEVAEEVLGFRKSRGWHHGYYRRHLNWVVRKTRLRQQDTIMKPNNKRYQKQNNVKNNGGRFTEVENRERNLNPRKFFQAVKEICGTFSPRLPTIKDKMGSYGTTQ